LTVRAAEDEHAFWLGLDGTYEPPIGLIGEAFDAVVGQNIARATALDLLGRMKSSLEEAARADAAGGEAVVRAGC
jgi:hypothetical protein